ncbi:hypothetical protein CBS101457_004236 [Exobasidium rhododendri]|nr:hypothetical protein CBS101457_004236 [Exobasidium rhododendri]
MRPLFLGLDSSTQALKASLLSNDLSVLSEVEVRFDRDLPHFGTRGGTLSGPPESGIVYSPVMLLVEALDLLLEKVKVNRWPVQDIRGVSAAGQQHASVYWSLQASSLLAKVNPRSDLTSQLRHAFSRQEIPNWQDSSTTAECGQLEEALGGAAKLAELTGSRAHTRFTGPQIMRFMKEKPKDYERTSRISLVSSFITSLLCLDGEIKGIDESDACGMNMWNMSTPERGWDHSVLMAIAGRRGSKALEEKLGRVESDGGRVVGTIGSWFVQRHGFSPECVVCPGTGDNPATFLSFSLQKGEGLVSLGTSDTVLVSTSTYNPDAEYHAFFHPAQIGSPMSQEKKATGSAKNNAGKVQKMRYFNMLVYKNGSLARERIRDDYFDSSWDTFNQAVEASRPKDAHDVLRQTGFWWPKPEIIPDDATGVHKYIDSVEVNRGQTHKVTDFDPPSRNASAILESQMMSFRSRASAILGGKDECKLDRVFATGGAASNSTICSVMADVLGCNVCKPVKYVAEEARWKNADYNVCSVAVGYKAAWSWYRHTSREEHDMWIPFDDFFKKCSEQRASKRKAMVKTSGMAKEEESNVVDAMDLLEEGVAIVARPDAQRSQAYTYSIDWWKALEDRALGEGRELAK